MSHGPRAVPLELSAVERAELRRLLRRRGVGQGLAQRIRVVLACAEPGATNLGVAAALGVSRPTVATWRRRGAFARGQARMQDLSDAGRAVLPNRVPDSGTVERAVFGLGSLGGYGLGYVSPEALAAGGGLLGAYSRPGSRLLTGLLAGRRPAAVGLLGETMVGTLPPAAGSAAERLLREPEPR